MLIDRREVVLARYLDRTFPVILSPDRSRTRHPRLDKASRTSDIRSSTATSPATRLGCWTAGGDSAIRTNNRPGHGTLIRGRVTVFANVEIGQRSMAIKGRCSRCESQRKERWWSVLPTMFPARRSVILARLPTSALAPFLSISISTANGSDPTGPIVTRTKDRSRRH